MAKAYVLTYASLELWDIAGTGEFGESIPVSTAAPLTVSLQQTMLGKSTVLERWENLTKLSSFKIMGHARKKHKTTE